MQYQTHLSLRYLSNFYVCNGMICIWNWFCHRCMLEVEQVQIPDGWTSKTLATFWRIKKQKCPAWCTSPIIRKKFAENRSDASICVEIRDSGKLYYFSYVFGLNQNSSSTFPSDWNCFNWFKVFHQHKKENYSVFVIMKVNLLINKMRKPLIS